MSINIIDTLECINIREMNGKNQQIDNLSVIKSNFIVAKPLLRIMKFGKIYFHQITTDHKGENLRQNYHLFPGESLIYYNVGTQKHFILDCNTLYIQW